MTADGRCPLLSHSRRCLRCPHCGERVGSLANDFATIERPEIAVLILSLHQYEKTYLIVKHACQLVAVEVLKVLLLLIALVVLRVQGLAVVRTGQDTFVIIRLMGLVTAARSALRDIFSMHN